MKWRWLVVVTVVVVGGAAGALFVFAGTQADADHAERSTRLAALIEKHDAAFRADERVLSALPLFARHTGNRSATAFLSPRMPGDRTTADAKLVVPTALVQPLDTGPSARFAEKIGVVDVSHVDTAWMKELAAYDYFDLDETPAWRSIRPLDARTAEVPAFIEAARWAKVRMLQGVTQNDLAAAGAETDELARLLLGSECTLGEAYGRTIIDVERQTYDAAVLRHVDAGTWAPLSARDLERLQRVTRAYRAYADVHATPAMFNVAALFGAPDAVVGRCRALGEEATRLLAVAPIVGADFFKDARENVDVALAASKGACRLQRVREAWANAEHQDSIAVGVDTMCSADEGTCPAVSFAAHLPGVRAWFIEDDVSYDLTDDFDGYNKPAKAR